MWAVASATTSRSIYWKKARAGSSLKKRHAVADDCFPPIVTGQRMFRIGRFGPIADINLRFAP